MATHGSRAYGSYQDMFLLSIKVFKWLFQPIHMSLQFVTLNLLVDIITAQIARRAIIATTDASSPVKLPMNMEMNRKRKKNAIELM